MKTADINIRDPFVLCEDGKYWLYGTRGPTCWGEADGFDVYTSTDLENWEGPFVCFHNDGTFWADRNYWAPQVHRRNGSYYMFASFLRPGLHRGTCILKADHPMGPFHPHSDGPITPREWECLDGTYYVSPDGTPYMVFCHEWVQVGDGEICAVRLTDDLRAPVGEPFVLFHASDAVWCRLVHHSSGRNGYVTDGPFLWRTEDGTLLCLWASFSQKGYTEAMAVSDNGDITGHFRQVDPLFREDGGHGMVFRAADGQLYLTLHTPNVHLQEHPMFIPLVDIGGRLAPRGSLPAWYEPLQADLSAMADRLSADLQPLSFPALTMTPEECGGVQQAIDRVAEQGGGTVRLTGEYVTGTIALRSHVNLRLEKGARLLASTDLADFPEHRARRLTVQDTSMGMHQSLIWAEGCSHIAITGEGIIDGRGSPDNFPGDETAQGTPGRPFLIRMIDCHEIEISGITLRNAACWMQNYLNCEKLLVRDLTVRNHANYNNDGIDIDGCRRVVIRHCNIHSGDDALCFKGAGMSITQDVLVEDCELFSACNAVKVGTDTQGSFRRIMVRNCRIGGLQEDPSGLKHPCADSGISLEMMDGGVLEDVIIRDCAMERAWSPIFLRLQDRGRVRPGDPKPAPGELRRCAIVNITGTECGPRGSYMLGVPEKPIRDILLKDISISQLPSDKPAVDESVFDDRRGLYPDAHMIDDIGDAPAKGLWARHVHGLTLQNYHVTAVPSDSRPDLVLKTNVRLDGMLP